MSLWSLTQGKLEGWVYKVDINHPIIFGGWPGRAGACPSGDWADMQPPIQHDTEFTNIWTKLRPLDTIFFWCGPANLLSARVIGATANYPQLLSHLTLTLLHQNRFGSRRGGTFDFGLTAIFIIYLDLCEKVKSALLCDLVSVVTTITCDSVCH